MYDKFNNKNVLAYACKTSGCENTIYFTKEQEVKYRKLGFVNVLGEVVKPKKCKSCREKYKKQIDIEKGKFYK
jgi:hypothetical protein